MITVFARKAITLDFWGLQSARHSMSTGLSSEGHGDMGEGGRKAVSIRIPPNFSPAKKQQLGEQLIPHGVPVVWREPGGLDF